MQLKLVEDVFKFKQVFRIAHGARTEARVVKLTLSDDGFIGHGECVPYPRYGESPQSVMAQIEAVRTQIEAGVSIDDSQRLLPNGAARNALDCALWDLNAKKQGKRVWEIANLLPPKPVLSAITIVIDDIDKMVASALSYKEFPLLKIKIGGEEDIASVIEIAKVRNDASLIIDANEALDINGLDRLLNVCDGLNIALIEQPLKASSDDELCNIKSPFTICADEAFHTSEDIEKLVMKYDAVNVKIDKTGGFTEGLKSIKAAKAAGMKTMMGCMVGTSLVTAPAQILANLTDWVDLDGPLLLAEDREFPLENKGAFLSPPEARLWG
jgi:L-alanine-DL-glutamate epimerase-like enolase superfamily enzyme